MGIVERDCNDSSESKQTINGNDSPIHRQQEPGIIRYIYEGIESTIQYLSTSLSNTSALYCGDKVEFSMMPSNKLAMNINLIERNRIRGWIAILREGKGFIEPSNSTGNNDAIAFSTNAFTGDNIQIELGDEVEFSLRKISGRLTAENILKVSLTINNFYSILPTIHRGRVVSPVRMISNDECEILGRVQKLSDDGIPGECYTFSITGIKNKRVILLPNDSVTFSIAVGHDYSTRAVNIVLENETRKGKVDTVKGQVRDQWKFDEGELLFGSFSLVLLILHVKKIRKSFFIIQKLKQDLNYVPVMKWNFMLNIILKAENHVRVNYVELSKNFLS